MATSRGLAVSGLLGLLAACSGMVSSATDPGATVPAAPSNVVAIAGNQLVSLTWVAPGNTGGSPITGYRVVVSPPTPSASIAVNGTSATVTSLTNGTAYTFTVAAVNAVGTGPASLPSAAVTPSGSAAGVPGPPTNVVATAGDAEAALTWAAPVDTGGSPITSYRVAISPPDASATITVSGATATVTSLTNGTAYTFTVAAVNAVGMGPASLPSLPVTPMVPLPGVPSAPGSVTARPGIASVSLGWTAPTTGAPLTGYVVSISPPTSSAVISVAGTTASVTGLANGATYTFTVAASNTAGTGPASSSGPVKTVDVPGTPTNLVAVAGDQWASLTWAAPASTGGSPITGYSIAISPQAASAQVSLSGTSAVVTSLTDGTPYVFTVAAVNAVGTGPASLPSLPVTPMAPPPGVPSAPGSVTATPGVASASLSWTAPTIGAPLTGYLVSILPPTPSAVVTVAGTTASVTGLANAATYTFLVVAMNAIGTGPAGLSGPITTADVPGAPTNVVAVAGDQSAALSWAAPGNTGGSPVTSYSVAISPPDTSATISVSGTTATVTSLTDGTAYAFTVAAVNAVGMGPASLPSLPVTPMAPLPGVPSAPGSVTATPGVASASLSWTAPTTGAPLTGYVVSILPPTPSAVVTVTGTTASVTGLANAATYTFTVAAVNVSGTGPATSSGPVTTPDVPGAPTTVVAVAGNQAASLTWVAPVSTGGSPLTGYSVVISPPAPSASISMNGTSATVTSLTNGTAYSFTVAAVNAVGTGPASLPSAAVTPSMPVPTLAQRRAFGAMAPGRGLSPATNFTIRLQNQVGAGNCVVLLVDYSSGIAVSSITDDANNSWSTVPAVSADAGSKHNKTEAYVLFNSNAGARNFTITFNAPENNVHFILLEYYNVGAVGVSTSSITAKAPTISTSAITPTAGSLVLHYSMDNTALIGEAGTSVTSFTAGPGWTLEAADYASGTTGGSGEMSFFVLQTLIASGGSITPTVTTTGKNSVNSIALELMAAQAGSPPPPGIRVLRMQDYLNVSINVSTWSEPFPSSGNLLAVFDSNGNITSAISDSNQNAWHIPVKGQNSVVCSLNYAANAATGPTLVMSWPITQGGNANTTVTAYDIVGADPVSPFVQSVTGPFTGISGPFMNQPIITPQKPNGVVLVVTGDGIGPITALTQPAGAYYLSSNYPGEVDNDTIDNADGYALYYYGTNLATQNYGWDIGTGGMSANSTGVEFAIAPTP